MYYKIVTERSFFTHSYDDIDIFNIPCGTVFTAPKTSKYKPDDPKCLIGKSLFHFADGAFDAMLWYTKLGYHSTIGYQIYAIQPLGKITKKRCPDDLGIYQCGAHQIKILEGQNTNEMYELALQEYFANPNRYTNFEINPDLWKKHQTTVFKVYKSYADSLPKKRYPDIPLESLLNLLSL